MFGTRPRHIALLALATLLLVAPAALAGDVQTRDSPTDFVVTLVDFLIHLVF